MSWNYRVCRYTTQGVELFSILEVHYTAAGEPESYGRASVADWESVKDLRGTLTLLQQALAKPVLDVSEDIGKLGRAGIDDPDNPPLTAADFAQMRPALDVMPPAAAAASRRLDAPDFEAIAVRIYFEATGETILLEEDTAPIVEQLRLVWNARGAADLAKVDTELSMLMGATMAGPYVKNLDRALRALDK